MKDHNAWLIKARSDLQSARKLSRDDDETFDTAVYHTQQCAEKALKAFLVFKKHAPLRTHDLAKLIEVCDQYDGSFKQLIDYASDLQPYAVYSRYPDDIFSVNQELTLKAIKKAEAILHFVERAITTMPTPNTTIFE